MHINWRYVTMAAVPAVLVAALLTFLAWPKGTDQANSPASQAATSRTVVVGTTTVTTPGAITTTAPATGPAPKVKLNGRYEGYCQDGKPVVTKAPPVTRSGWTEIRPDCKGNLFGTLVVDLKSTEHYIGPKPGEPPISDVR